MKDNLKVFSCFAGIGGSSLGYKLAGFDVIGALEIDKKAFDVYFKIHNPKLGYNMDIRDFNKLENIPQELFNLDILDGSPPCSSFSLISTKREQGWGKEKKFKEGQKKQILDTLFFEFIETANILKPKVVICENVTGLIKGNAKKYYAKILSEFEKIGYKTKTFVLNSKVMEVPQSRERLFIISVRNDLLNDDLLENNIFKDLKLKLKFDFKEIPFKYVLDKEDKVEIKNKKHLNAWKGLPVGKSFEEYYGGSNFFGYRKIDPEKPCPTILGKCCHFHPYFFRYLNLKEIIKIQSFPDNYFSNLDLSVNFIERGIGLSVPPNMMKNVAIEVKKQILEKINKLK